LANVYKCNWNYGNAIHDSYRILGLISLRNGNIEEAADFLSKAGKSTGSPQLDTFGPELDLADKLLAAGKDKEVISYLSDIKKFWEMDNGRIDRWIAEIERGNEPELNRYSGEFSTWQLIFMWFTQLWPLILVLGSVVLLRKKIVKKIKYVVISVVLAYLTMIIFNIVSASVLPIIIQKITESGNDGLLMPAFYTFIAGGYIVPLLVVVVISRYFIKKGTEDLKISTRDE
jgi:hypothetical protein